MVLCVIIIIIIDINILFVLMLMMFLCSTESYIVLVVLLLVTLCSTENDAFGAGIDIACNLGSYAGGALCSTGSRPYAVPK